ncbi:MAG: S8 family serine peptidase [Opitutaceae bacterium]|nr:S8 family serine peptidase [Opitutaceae bacterium]
MVAWTGPRASTPEGRDGNNQSPGGAETSHRRGKPTTRSTSRGFQLRPPRTGRRIQRPSQRGGPDLYGRGSLPAVSGRRRAGRPAGARPARHAELRAGTVHIGRPLPAGSGGRRRGGRARRRGQHPPAAPSPTNPGTTHRVSPGSRRQPSAGGAWPDGQQRHLGPRRDHRHPRHRRGRGPHLRDRAATQPRPRARHDRHRRNRRACHGGRRPRRRRRTRCNRRRPGGEPPQYPRNGGGRHRRRLHSRAGDPRRRGCRRPGDQPQPRCRPGEHGAHPGHRLRRGPGRCARGGGRQRPGGAAQLARGRPARGLRRGGRCRRPAGALSNSGPQLQLTAPGYGLQTAWADGTRVLFDGTSGSAPIVAGAIAAVLSQNRGLTAAQALAVLTSHSSDGGAPGNDPDYGHGSLNLGWALAGNDPNRVDTAVSSHFLDPATGALHVVIQNRSARGVNGLELAVALNGTSRSVVLPWLEAGASTAVPLALEPALLARGGSLAIESQLKNPPGIVDAVPANNARSSLLTSPPPEG